LAVIEKRGSVQPQPEVGEFDEAHQTTALRPRGFFAILDTSFELTSTEPALLWLTWIGMAPVALMSLFLWYGAREALFTQSQEYLVAMACALLALLRYIPAGAAVRLVLAGIEGKKCSPVGAIREAISRAPSLVVAGSLSMWITLLSVPMCFFTLFIWSGAYLGLPLTLERDCAPWSVIGAGKRLIRNRPVRPGTLTLAWGLGVLLLSANLWGALFLGLTLAESLFDLDISLLGRLLSPSNSIFLPSLGVLSLIALEPIRQISLAVAYLDARVRRDALDLHNEAAELADQIDASTSPKWRISSQRNLRSRGATSSGFISMTLIFFALLAAPAAPALAQSSAEIGALERALYSEDPKASFISVANQLIDAGVELPEAEQVHINGEDSSEVLSQLPLPSTLKLAPLTQRLRQDLDEGRVRGGLLRLRAAFAEMDRLTLARQDASDRAANDHVNSTDLVASEGDAKAILAELLLRPEFQRETRKKVRLDGEQAWLDRLQKSIQAFLERLFRRGRDQRSQTDPKISTGPLLPATLSWILWGSLIAVVVLALVFAIMRALGHEAEPGDEAEALEEQHETIGNHPQEELPLDALSRSSDAWLSEADRLAANSQFREALRCAYLAVLGKLHHAGAIEYRPEYTNIEHLRSYKGSPEGESYLRKITLAFERSWYGFHELTSSSYLAQRTLAIELIALSARGRSPSETPGELSSSLPEITPA